MPNTTSRIFSVLVFAVLVFPFVVLSGFFISQSDSYSLTLPNRTVSVFMFTILQVSLSTAIAMVFGSAGALGLLSLRRLKKIIEALALLPNLVPVLFVIVSFMNLLPNLRGLWGIVFLHAILNIGLVSVALSRLIATRAGGLSELAYVEGASRFLFLRRGLWPLLKKDFSLIALFVFTLCFMSFAIPLVVGGSRATTIEVLIYENIRSYSDWPKALSLSILQTFFILLISFTLRKEELSEARTARVAFSLLGAKPALLIVCIPGVLIFLGLIKDFPQSWQVIQGNYELLHSMLPSYVNSFFVSILTGVFVVLGFFAIVLAQPRTKMRHVLLGYVAPSSVLTGFAILILWRATGAATLVKISIGLALVAIPALYRFRFDRALLSLRAQGQTAQILGASNLLIFKKILVPQLWQEACRLAAIAAFWAWGDFAVSRVVAEAPVTLALQVQGLMESYRLDLAILLVWILIAGALLSYIFFEGLGYVFHPKSQS